MKKQTEISLNKQLMLVELQKTTERLNELRLKLLKFIETMVDKKTISLKEGNQPLIYDQGGAFAIETIYKDGRCYGISNDGVGEEFDFADLSADDLNGIAEAVIQEIK